MRMMSMLRKGADRGIRQEMQKELCLPSPWPNLNGTPLPDDHKHDTVVKENS